jgi:hypothetical protein
MEASNERNISAVTRNLHRTLLIAKTAKFLLKLKHYSNCGQTSVLARQMPVEQQFDHSKQRYFVCRSIWCVFPRPLQVLLPSATGWITGVSSFLQPAGALRYQRDPAHWHETSLPAYHRNLTSRPIFEGGGGYTATHKSNEHFLKYVVTPLKYRLPTWRLHTKKPYDSTVFQHRLMVWIMQF